MSQQCAIPKCYRTSRGLCDCCQRNLCLQHLNEHNTSLISQLNPLTDEINTLADRLRTTNIQSIVRDGRQKLEQWRVDCHQTIDRFFVQKCEELDRHIAEKVNEQNRQISQIRAELAQIIEQQETTRQDIDSLKSTIRSLERKMYETEQTCFQITTRPLEIDERSISIEETNEHEIDLSTLSEPCKFITLSPGNTMALACSEWYLLIQQNLNLCLMNRKMNIVKQTLCSNDELYDMCWSSTLNQFIVLTDNNVLLVDEETGVINTVSIALKQNWLSCTCSDTFLFLSTNECASSIMQFGFLPAIEFIKEWKSPQTCGEEDIIHDMICKNETLALMIESNVQSIRMELRSVATLHRIWSLQLDIVSNGKLAVRCCPLTCNQWLVTDQVNNRLLQITKDGKLKRVLEYPTSPVHAVVFGPDVLVISGRNGIKFHKL